MELNANRSIYELGYYAVDMKKQAGTSKSTAKALKIRGKALESYSTISDSQSKVDWYKFTVTTSNQFVDFSIGYMLDGDIVFQILDSKGRVLYNSKVDTNCKEGYYYYWVGNNYAKGTYYIKVFKGSKNSSYNYAVGLINVLK